MSDYPAPPPPPGPPPGGYGGPPGGYGGPPGGYGGPPAGYGGGYGGFQLPPGVEVASVGRRIGAYFLAFPLLVVTLILGYLVWGAVIWGKGTSPALRVLGMRCVDANTGQPVGWGKMALRDIVGGIVQGILSFITLIVSFVMFLSGERHQSLPDKIGSTVVVYDPNKVMG